MRSILEKGDILPTIALELLKIEKIETILQGGKDKISYY